MRIERIELEHFRCYDQAGFDLLEPRTLLVGRNGSGKSTLIDAIAWTLLGRCRGVDGKGQGQRDLIQHGADRATVRLFVTHGGRQSMVERTVGATGPASTNYPAGGILAMLGTTEPLVTAALYGRTFFDLHHGDAKGLLLRLLDVRVPVESVPGVTVPAGQDTVDLDTLEAEYQRAFADRAALKKVLAGIVVPDLVRNVQLERLDPAAIQADSDAAQAALVDVAGLVGRLDNEISQLTKARAAAQAHLQTEAVALKAKATAHEDMLTEANSQVDLARADLATVEAQPDEPVKELRASVARSQDLIARLKTHQPGRGCVLSADIPCHTDAAAFAGQLQDLDAQVAALSARVEAGDKRTMAVAAARQRVKDAERQVVYHTTQAKDAQDLLAHRAEWEQKADAASAALADLDPQLVDATTALAAARERVKAVRAIQTDLDDYLRAVAAWKAAQEARAKAWAALDAAETLVALLGPKGVRAIALQAALDDFLGAINAALEPFAFELSIQVDPWGIFVRNTGGDGPVAGGQPQPFDLLSDGEKLWTGLAVQLALAAFSGLDFCAVDATETVVDEARRVLTGVVMQAPVDQIIVAMAKGRDEALPALPGLQVIQVEQLVPAGA